MTALALAAATIVARAALLAILATTITAITVLLAEQAHHIRNSLKEHP